MGNIARRPLVEIGNDWSRSLFDGGANDPSSLGGGATDTHLIYEGLSRLKLALACRGGSDVT